MFWIESVTLVVLSVVTRLSFASRMFTDSAWVCPEARLIGDETNTSFVAAPGVMLKAGESAAGSPDATARRAYPAWVLFRLTLKFATPATAAVAPPPVSVEPATLLSSDSVTELVAVSTRLPLASRISTLTPCDAPAVVFTGGVIHTSCAGIPGVMSKAADVAGESPAEVPDRV